MAAQLVKETEHISIPFPYPQTVFVQGAIVHVASGNQRLTVQCWLIDPRIDHSTGSITDPALTFELSMTGPGGEIIEARDLKGRHIMHSNWTNLGPLTAGHWVIGFSVSETSDQTKFASDPILSAARAYLAIETH